MDEKHKKKEPTISSLPKKLATLPGIAGSNPIVLKPNVSSKKISIIKTEKIRLQKPKTILSNSGWYFWINFFKTITNVITSIIFKILGNETKGSLLKYKFTIKEKKNRIRSWKV